MHKMMPIVIGGMGLVGGVLLNTFYQPVATQQSTFTDVVPPTVATEENASRPPAATFTPLFEPCAHCHQVGNGARNSNGPVLNGIVGQPSTSTDYPYSQAMKNADVIWDEETLTAFLVAPEEVVPGSRMIFAGLSESEARTIIDFLRNLSP